VTDVPGGGFAAPDSIEEKIRHFTLYAPWLQEDPITTFDEMREVGPILRSEGHGGFWILTRHEDVEWAARTPEIFSSEEPLIPYHSALGEERQIPLSLDGEEHRLWRQTLSGTFSPGTINHFTPEIRSVAAELVGRIAQGESCDFITEFAVALPAETFLIDFGVGRERLAELLRFKDWFIREALPSAHSDEEITAAAKPLRDFFAEVVEERRRDPELETARDVVSQLLHSTYNGRPPTMSELTNALFVSMMASLDTTTSALGLIWEWLATHPEERAAMIADPARQPRLIEELLRALPVLTTARIVTQDVERRGVQIRRGDKVMLTWGMSGLDPAEFACPHAVDLDRAPGRLLAFGVGPHRCLGMHLARRVIAIAIEEWHSRIPDYRIAPEGARRHFSSVRGLSSLPLELR
jgi:cytochrome P450